MSPRCLAIVMCDRVLRDDQTGQHTLSKVHDSGIAPSYPTRIAPFGLYLALADVRTPTPLTLLIVRQEDDGSETPVFSANTTARPHPMPDHTLDMDASVPEIVLPSAGRYFVRLLHAGNVIAERRLTMHQEPHR